MANERIEFTTPVGRIVAGDLFTPRTTDHAGAPLVVKTGANAGQPRQEYYIGLAIAKTDPNFGALWAAMTQAGRQGFPTLFDANGNCLRQDFAFKLIDGDSTVMNQNNNRPCDKEGYPGHWVLNLATSIAPKIYDRNNQLIAAESKAVKRGDYVRVHLSIAPNGNAQKPGIYLNPVAVQFSHAGEEIFSGIDAAAIFGANPMPAAPVGAVTTPQPTLAAMPVGTTTPNPAQGYAQQAAPMNTSANVGAVMPPVSTVAAGAAVAGMNNGAMTAATPQNTPAPVSVQPAPDFLNPAPVAPVAPAVEEKFLINGQAWTRAQLHASGWNDDQINAQPRA